MTTKKINRQEFIKNYCQTIERDQNNQFFLKIPVKNYEELNLLRAAMLNAIEFTAELHELNPKNRLPLTVHYLTHILHNIDFFTECQGLTEITELK